MKLHGEVSMTLKDQRKACEAECLRDACVKAWGKPYAMMEVLGVSRATLYRLLKQHGMGTTIERAHVVWKALGEQPHEMLTAEELNAEFDRVVNMAEKDRS